MDPDLVFRLDPDPRKTGADPKHGENESRRQPKAAWSKSQYNLKIS